MYNSQVPSKFVMPFAKNAGVGYIRTVPSASQIGVTNGAASLNDGFPPLTFQPVGSGGIPPFGQDFNGLFNQITAWNQWQAAGGTVQYDASFAASIGGYPNHAIVVSSVTTGLFWLNTVDNNLTNPDSGGVGWIAFGPATVLPILTGSATYYVNASTGSDSNAGTSSGAAFQTIAKALAVISTFNLNGYNVTVQVANGTYSAPVILPAINGSGTVNFVGNSGSPSSVIIAGGARSAIFASQINGAQYSFNGFSLGATGETGSLQDPGACIYANGPCSINFNNIILGACHGAWAVASASAYVSFAGSITVTGSPTANAYVGGIGGVGFYAGAGGYLAVNGTAQPSITISTPVTVTCFIQAAQGASTDLLFSSITGGANVTGSRYNAFLNGSIQTLGGGASYYPGSTSGSLTTGGQYA